MQIINYRLRLNTISALLFAHFNTKIRETYTDFHKYFYLIVIFYSLGNEIQAENYANQTIF